MMSRYAILLQNIGFKSNNQADALGTANSNLIYALQLPERYGQFSSAICRIW